MTEERKPHDEEPLVPKAMEICRMPSGEEYIQCLWCPCSFVNVHDFNLHVAAFGKTEERHRQNWRNRNWQREDSDSSE